MNTKKNQPLIFGPIKSRRLGISLGIDLIPRKVCSLDCVYCECGKTLTLSTKRKEFFKFKSTISEIDSFFMANPNLQTDYITFSGHGEPTLYSKIGEIISYLKQKYPQYKVALLTNSTLLYQEDLRKELLPLDLIVPSLDAVSESAFNKINRPHSQLTVDMVLDGLLKFRQEFSGQFWVEVFIIPGINDSTEEIVSIKEWLTKINPHKIQLNTLDRPGTESSIRTPTISELENLQKLFEPFEVEIYNSKWNEIHSSSSLSSTLSSSTSNSTSSTSNNSNIEDAIINTIKRRPCTLEDLKVALGANNTTLTIESTLKILFEKKIITSRKEDRGEFYFVI
ncbi:MAG: radical SAM protein [Oligoflexia bacterium]|nr:radical SAM protein [Oligoflexia bacterium]